MASPATPSSLAAKTAANTAANSSNHRCPACSNQYAGSRVLCDDCLMAGAAQVTKERAASGKPRGAGEAKVVALSAQIPGGSGSGGPLAGSGPSASSSSNNKRGLSALEIFELCDTDGSGSISLAELEMGMRMGLFEENADPENCMRSLMHIKKDGWRSIDWANGFSLLHWASANDRPRLVRHLLGNGADPTIPDESGRSPYDYAKAHSCRRALAELTAYSPKLALAQEGRPVDRGMKAKVGISQPHHRGALSSLDHKALQAAHEVQDVASEVFFDTRVEKFRQLFYKLDTNGDGRLSEEEINAGIRAGYLKDVEHFVQNLRSSQREAAAAAAKKEAAAAAATSAAAGASSSSSGMTPTSSASNAAGAAAGGEAREGRGDGIEGRQGSSRKQGQQPKAPALAMSYFAYTL